MSSASGRSSPLKKNTTTNDGFGIGSARPSNSNSYQQQRKSTIKSTTSAVKGPVSRQPSPIPTLIITDTSTKHTTLNSRANPIPTTLGNVINPPGLQSRKSATAGPSKKIVNFSAPQRSTPASVNRILLPTAKGNVPVKVNYPQKDPVYRRISGHGSKKLVPPRSTAAVPKKVIRPAKPEMDVLKKLIPEVEPEAEHEKSSQLVPADDVPATIDHDEQSINLDKGEETTTLFVHEIKPDSDHQLKSVTTISLISNPMSITTLKNNLEILENSTTTTSSKDIKSSPRDNTNASDFQSFLEMLKSNPNAFLLLDKQVSDLRLPTNSPDYASASSSASASTLVSYQHYENLRTLIQSRHLLRRIKSRSTPCTSGIRGSGNNSSSSLRNEDEIIARKTAWLLLRNGVTTTITGTTADGNFEYKMKYPYDYVRGMGLELSRVSSSEIGIDSIEPPDFVSLSDLAIPSCKSKTELEKVQWLNDIGSLTIQPKVMLDSCFFLGLRLPIFNGSALPNFKTSERGLTPLYNIYADFSDSKVPTFRAYESSFGTAQTQTCQGWYCDTEDGLKIHVRCHPSYDPTNTSAVPEKDKDILILECQECPAPDCTLHSATLLTCNGTVRLGTANFLTCDKERPIVVLRNLISSETFIVRTRNFIPESTQSSDFFIYQISDLDENDNYPKDAFDDEKIGPCIGSISRRSSKMVPFVIADKSFQDSTNVSFPKNSNDNTDALILNFSGSMTSDTKILLLGGTLLIVGASFL